MAVLMEVVSASTRFDPGARMIYIVMMGYNSYRSANGMISPCTLSVEWMCSMSVERSGDI